MIFLLSSLSNSGLSTCVYTLQTSQFQRLKDSLESKKLWVSSIFHFLSLLLDFSRSVAIYILQLLN